MIKVQDNNYNEKNLHINKIHNKPDSKISFTGHKVVQDDEGKNVYRFYLPPLALKDGQTASVEIVKLKKDDNGNYQVLEKSQGKPNIIKRKDFNQNENSVNVYFTELGLSKNPKDLKNTAIGYRFKIGDNEYLDSTLLTPDRKWNIATPPSRPILEEARSMYHLLPDLMLSKETIKKNPGIYDARRTHFNKMGGNIQGIIEKIDYIKDLGARRILGTPIFGQDNISSHGYWTTNPNQVTDGLGDMAKFKELNTKLYKNDMAWIADGAFVNEGLEGIHAGHIIKWGPESPYADWISTFDFPDNPLKFGILSKKDDVNNQNLGIRLVNAKHKVLLDENGKETVEYNKNYDSKKPTYVQVYDKRLASRKQVNSSEIIRSYDKKNPDDPNEINNYMDSFVPYKFQINPEEASQKIENWRKHKTDESSSVKEVLTEWTNFGTEPSHSDGGGTLWVGNKDIYKLRFMFTAGDENKIRAKYGKNADQKIKHVKQSVNQVQDSIVQVGEFWTNEVAKTLHSYTAKQLAGAAKNDESTAQPEDYVAQIKKQVSKGELPQAALKVNEEQIKNLLEDNYTLKTAPAPQSVTDGLMSYPLDAIEFDPSMSAILGSPFLKKLASTEDQIGKSRYEIYEEQKELDYKDIPEEFRPVYKKMDKLIAGKMTQTAVEILKEVQNTGQLNENIIDEGTNELTEEGKELYSLISNDVAKFIVTQALLEETDKNSPRLLGLNQHPDYNNKEALVYKTEMLRKVSPESLGINAANPAGEAESIIDKLNAGIDRIKDDDKAKFAEHLANRLSGLDANTVKVAKLVVDKAEGGLEWRIDAAKDVCPIEEIQEGEADFEENWTKGVQFWERFTSGVEKYNPRKYEILEITDEADIVTANSERKRKKYKDGYEANSKLIQGSGATTPTNYNFLYSWPHELYGANTESGSVASIWDITGKLLNGWCNGEPNHAYGLLHSGSLDTVNQSHNSIGNHDKPRALHGFGLDMKIFFTDANELNDWANKDTQFLKDEAKKEIENKTWKGNRWAESALKVKENMKLFYGENPDLSKVDGKTLAMGIAVKEALEDSKAYKKLDNKYKKDIQAALVNLTNGKYTKKDGTKGEYDAEYFGYRPFDRNIKDVMIEAKRISKSGFDKVDTKEIEKETLGNMLVPAMKKYRAAIGLLTAMPGNPTIYAGDELGETGFEYKYKNPLVQNRNHIHYNRAEKDNPEYIKEIAEQKNEIAKLMNLRKKEALSPLVNGSTVVLKMTKNEEKDAGIAGIYRYNDKSDMFALFTDYGFGKNRNTTGAPLSIPSIDLSEEQKLEGSNPNSILNNLKDGTTYKNVLDENDKSIYRIVEEGGKKLLKRFDEKGQSIDIEMKKSDLFLYRTEDFNGKKQTVSFSGNSAGKNPHVAIANMKYGIPAVKSDIQANRNLSKTKAVV